MVDIFLMCFENKIAKLPWLMDKKKIIIQK